MRKRLLTAVAAVVGVLAVTATGDDVGAARARAYKAASRISFAGMRYRRDIALAAAEGHVRT